MMFNWEKRGFSTQLKSYNQGGHSTSTVLNFYKGGNMKTEAVYSPTPEALASQVTMFYKREQVVKVDFLPYSTSHGYIAFITYKDTSK